MGMLERIKKRQFDGFKEFVVNLETTGIKSRNHILSLAILEDPVFMTYVMKNIRTFDDFMKLPTYEIETVISHQDQIATLLAKCFFGMSEESILTLQSIVPRHFARLNDELSYLKDLTTQEKESAQFHIVKLVRKLQTDDHISGFNWQLPPLEVFQSRTYKDGRVQIFFESGTVAAQGDYFKSKREGHWKHFYDSGKLFAEGNYENGLKAGEWTYYFKNSEPKSRGLFKEDLRHGEWSEWDRSGLVQKVTYKAGIKLA